MCHLRWSRQPSLDFLLTVTSRILKEHWMPKWKGCKVLGFGPRKTGGSADGRRWGATVAEGSTGWCYPQTLADTMVYMNVLYFPLRSGKEHRQLRLTPWGHRKGRRKTIPQIHREHTCVSKITQGDCVDKKWSRRWSFIMQIKTVQSAALWGCSSATLPSCQQTVQQMPFICSLHAIQHQHVGSLLHHWDTIHHAEPSAEYARSRHW